MAKIFIYSNSFSTMTFMCKLKYILNIEIDEVLLLKENHRQTEKRMLGFYGYDINVYSNIDDCIAKCDYIFAITNSNMPSECIEYVARRSNKLCKKYIEIKNPWSEKTLTKKEMLKGNLNDSKNYPLILLIALDDSSQQYYTEILLNEIFAENGINIKQVFSPSTYSILKQLSEYDLVSYNLVKQFKEIKKHVVNIYSVNIGADFNNIVNYMDIIKILNPDYVILQTGIRFCEYEVAKQIIKWGCSSTLDLIIKSHYNNVTLNDAKIYYCDNQILVDDLVNDIENSSLKESVTYKILTKLSLPNGVLRI